MKLENVKQMWIRSKRSLLFTSYSGGRSRRTAMYIHKRFGDVIQFMKETVDLIYKTNVTKLHIDRRFKIGRPIRKVERL